MLREPERCYFLREDKKTVRQNAYRGIVRDQLVGNALNIEL